MPKARSITVWLNSACRSMMPLCRELAGCSGVPVHLVVRRPLTMDRMQLGWAPDDGGDARVTVLTNHDWKLASNAILDEAPGALNLITGYQRDPYIRHVAFRAMARGHRMAVLSEAPLNAETGIRRKFKEAYLRAILVRRVAPIVAASERIFCLSGRRFSPLEKIGWPHRKIVPFGYFPADRGRRSACALRTDGSMRLVCIGFLHAHKGVDLLLRAVARLAAVRIHLDCDITGEGSEMASLRQLHSDLGLGAAVRFHGIVSDERLDELVANADVLVVPGRNEPWGIRVNEGIQAGLAVVVSDRVGAADLVSFSGGGLVFRSGDVGELAQSIYDLSTDPRLLLSAKLAANAYRPWIDPALAAKHLIDVMNLDPSEVPAVAPWAGAGARDAVRASISVGA